MIIKTNLKLKKIPVEKIKDMEQFIEVYSQKSAEYKWNLHFLM
jgi:hypothetical protein